MTVTADMVKDLREKTGSRMMDCKAALTAVNGSFDDAVAWLKQRNLNTGEKSASKSNAEGLLGHWFSDDTLTVVELSASTDFGANNSEFRAALKEITRVAHEQNLTSVEALNSYVLPTGKTVQLALQELAGKMGENIALKQVVRTAGNFGYYIHHNDKEGAIVEIDGATGELAQRIGKDIAMHCVFAKPLCLSREEVPSTDVDSEKTIIMARLADDPKNAKKPPQIIEKIIAGQLDKFYAKSVLVDQAYYKEEKKTVSQILAELGVTVKRFTRLQIALAEAKQYLTPGVKCHQCMNPDCKGVCTCGTITVRVTGE